MEITLDFKESIFGSEKRLDMSHLETCTSCSGSGARPWHSPQHVPLLPRHGAGHADAADALWHVLSGMSWCPLACSLRYNLVPSRLVHVRTSWYIPGRYWPTTRTALCLALEYSVQYCTVFSTVLYYVALGSRLGQVSTCATCSGSGEVITDFCKRCSGEGRLRVHKQVPLSIPAGVASGSALRVRGDGDAGLRG